MSSDGEFRQIYDGQVAQLVIDEVFLDDSGHYKVTAKNDWGEVSSECDLIVKGKNALSIMAHFHQWRRIRIRFLGTEIRH